MLRSIVLSGIAAAAMGLPALAEDAVATKPIAAASLYEGPLDMVAYFRPIESNLYEVTATFVADEVGEPMRVVMAMRDGDAVKFDMPNYRDATYSFSRLGEALSVSVDVVQRTALSE